jgi:SAM-dependent methyltransferase
VIANKLSNYLKAVCDHGLISATTSYWERVHEHAYETWLGIRSGDIISLKDLGIEHEDRREHFPAPLRDFRSMKKFLWPAKPNEVFIDYGSGLGRVVVLAAMMPFRRVIGVEISPLLVERARDNLARCQGKLRCKNVEIINTDAAMFDVPDDTTTFFFNNPFAGTILRSVLVKIYESYRQRPRTIKLLCYLPPISAFEDQVCQFGYFQLVARLGLAKGRKCLVFSMKEAT